jgi:transposase-like protein
MVTTTTELIDTGEKRDEKGRRISTVERRAEAVAEWRGSGLTMAAFARREGIEYSTFAGWVLKAARRRPRAKRPRFAEVRVGPVLASAPTANLLEVRLPDGIVVRGASATELAALVRALRS